MGAPAAVGFSVKTGVGNRKCASAPDFGDALWEDELDGWVGAFGAEREGVDKQPAELTSVEFTCRRAD